MKAIVKNPKEEKKEIKYPCLMVCENLGQYVLFHKHKAGIVIESGNSIECNGQYSDSFSMESFEPFNGTIELSND